MNSLNIKLFFRAWRLGGVAIALTAAMLVGGCGGPGLEERPVNELVELLQGDEESQAIAAVSALREKKDPAGLDPLIQAARESQFDSVRKLAAMGLQWFDNPKAIAALVVLMEEGEGDVVPEAQGGFEFAVGQKYQNLGAGMTAAKAENPDAYEGAFGVLEGLLQSDEEFTVSNAIVALGQTGDPRAGVLLVQQLKQGTDFQKGKAIAALGGIDSPESVAALKEAVSDGNSVVAKAASTALRNLGYVDLELLKAELETRGTRAGAIATLGKMETPESLQLLKAQLDATPSDREKVIQALGNRPDSGALQVLFDFIKGENPRSPKVVSTLKLIGEKGKKSQDPQVPKRLIEAYRTNNFPTGAVILSLGAMGDVAYEPAKGLLDDKEPKMQVLGAAALGTMGNEEAIAPLAAKLTNWNVAPKAGESLKKLEWTPTNDREKVLMWLAARDKTQLTGNWETTKTVLLAEASGGNQQAVSNALYGFMGIGDETVIPALKQNLNNRGSKEVALAYLNCGQPELEAAAKDWASRNGYRVFKAPGGKQEQQWGNF